MIRKRLHDYIVKRDVLRVTYNHGNTKTLMRDHFKSYSTMANYFEGLEKKGYYTTTKPTYHMQLTGKALKFLKK